MFGTYAPKDKASLITHHGPGTPTPPVSIPALAPQVDYSELEGVVDGLAASTAFERVPCETLGKGESAPELRASLLRYSKLDTLAMVEVHRALLMSDWENDECYHLTDYIDEEEKTKQTL